MADRYGTKAWAKWANQNLEFSLMLLKEPNKQWDEQMTYLQSATRSLNIMKTDLDMVLARKSGKD